MAWVQILERAAQCGNQPYGFPDVRTLLLVVSGRVLRARLFLRIFALTREEEDLMFVFTCCEGLDPQTRDFIFRSATRTCARIQEYEHAYRAAGHIEDRHLRGAAFGQIREVRIEQGHGRNKGRRRQ